MIWLALLIGLLTPNLGISTLVKDPVNCSSRPCTYTHTCATATCTSGEVDELWNDAVLDAEKGDTVICEAGRTYPMSGRELTARAGTGTLNIQTSLLDRLADALITPEQEAALCTFAVTSSIPGVLIPSHSSPVEDIAFRGIRWTLDSSYVFAHANGLLRIGGRHQENFTVVGADDTIAGALASWIPNDTRVSVASATLGFDTDTVYYVVQANGSTYKLSTTLGGGPVDITGDGTIVLRAHWLSAWGPNNITIDRNLVTIDQPAPYSTGQVLGRGFTFNDSRAVTVDKTWIDDVANGADSQDILITGGGPYTVTNSYFGGATENIMLGGAGSSIQMSPVTGTFEGNIFAKPVRWRQQAPWEANTWYEIGSLRKPVDLSAVFMQAQNSGTSGGSEPTWPGSVGQTVVDNEITWMRHSQGFSTKNNFEIKSANDVKFIRNGLYWHWEGGQKEMLVIKRSSTSTTGQETAAPRTGVVDVTGSTVTWVSGDKLPWGEMAAPWTTITINETAYTVDTAASGWDTTGGSDETLELTTSPGPLDDVSFTHGDQVDNHQLAQMSNIFVAWNRARHGPHFMMLRDLGNVQCCSSNNQVIGNLATHLGEPWGGVGTTNVWVFNGLGGTNRFISHNTTDRLSDPDLGRYQMAGRWGDSFSAVDNIFPGRVLGISVAEGQAAVTRFMCGDVPCSVTQWDKNMFIGGPTSTYTVGTHYNGCPTSAGCSDPDYSTIYEDRTNGKWGLVSTHAGFQNGTDGLSIGADPNLVPDIDVRVEVSDTWAIIKIKPTAGVKDFPCVTRTSTARDLRTLIPDQDVTQGASYAAAYADNQDGSPINGERYIPIGIRTALTPSTTYYYGVYCGGAQLDVPWNDLVRSFTTLPALTGTETISISGKPTAVGTDDRVIQFGATYDRATDAIQSPSLGTEVACTTAASCLVNFTRNKGDFRYYRVLDRDISNVVLASGPVR